MNRKIILAGSGGHAKVLRNILEETNLIISYLVTKDRDDDIIAVSYTHLTLPTTTLCRSRWSPYH